MKNKISIAAISMSILTISLMNTLSASAESRVIYAPETSAPHDMIVITEGTELTSEMLTDETLSVHPVDNRFKEMNDDSLSADLSALKAHYGNNARLYDVSFKWNTTTSLAQQNRYARRIMLNHEAICYVGQGYIPATQLQVDLLLQFHTTDEAQSIAGLNEIMTTLNSSDAARIVLPYRNEVSAWKEACTAILQDCDMNTLTIKELDEKLQERNLRTTSEMEQYAMSTGNEMIALMPDKLTDVFLGAESIYLTDSPTASTNIWQNVGCVTSESTPNASDAARILIESARKGAGLSSGFQPTSEAMADVNADGAVNASDAAIVLMYAAAVGAGQDVSISDCVK